MAFDYRDCTKVSWNRWTSANRAPNAPRMGPLSTVLGPLCGRPRFQFNRRTYTVSKGFAAAQNSNNADFPEFNATCV
jgi:hypothetical protein